MFEDFSFSSPQPPRVTFDPDDRLMVDSDSTLISPRSSRCPSPQPSQQRFPRSSARRSSTWRQPPPPTSVPFAYDHRRLSIGTLTRKLHEHTLRQPGEDNLVIPEEKPAHTLEDTCLSPRSVPDLVPGSRPGSSSAAAARIPGYFLTPPDTDHDEDYEGDSFGGDYVSSPFLSPTSVPSPAATVASSGSGSGSGNAGGAGELEALHVRNQRQRISRMQCNPTDVEAIRRELLAADSDMDVDAYTYRGYGEDDCHPSSLPPSRSPRRRTMPRSRSRSPVRTPLSGAGAGFGFGHAAGRRKSSSGALLSSDNRIDKSYSTRELRKKSEQGLRRKSLVSAALASMVERAL